MAALATGQPKAQPLPLTAASLRASSQPTYKYRLPGPSPPLHSFLPPNPDLEGPSAMRTLTLLAALFLLAFQAQAQTLQETVDQLPAQDQPGDKDQDQPGDEDQDVAIYFTGDGRITRNAAGETPTHVLLGSAAHYRGLLESTQSLVSKLRVWMRWGEEDITQVAGAHRAQDRK